MTRLFAVPDSASDSSATSIEARENSHEFLGQFIQSGQHDVFEQLSFHWKSAQRTCSTDKTCTVGLLAVHVLWRHYID